MYGHHVMQDFRQSFYNQTESFIKIRIRLVNKTANKTFQKRMFLGH